MKNNFKKFDMNILDSHLAKGISGGYLLNNKIIKLGIEDFFLWMEQSEDKMNCRFFTES